MKVLPSTLLKDYQPVDDGYDLALAFAHGNRKELEEFIEQQKSALRHLETAIRLEKEKKTYLPGAVVAGGSLLLLLFVHWIFSLGIIAGGVWAYLAYKKQQEAIVEKEEEKLKTLARPVPQAVTHLGKLHYVVNVVPFEDGNLVLDATGTRAKDTLTYPEIPQGSARLQTLSDSLSQIPQELPVLLPPAGQGDLQDKPQLTGVEADMEQILSLCERIFSDTVDIRTDLPVFAANDDLVVALKKLSAHVKDGKPALDLTQYDPIMEQAVKSLAQTSAEAAEVKKLGAENIENLMKDVVERMDSYVTRANRAREHSLMDILSAGLDGLKTVYDYPLTRFYCPKCHQVKQHQEASLAVPLEQLPQAPPEALSPFYRSQEMLHLRGLADTIRRYLAQARERGEDFSAEHLMVLQEKLRTYEERIRQLAMEIEHLDPHVEVHKRNAILKYNLIRKVWICQLCGEAFSDEQAQWARMLKVKDDLIIPLWDQLWLEKHDERNRIIREKEKELRENREKESSQLREEAKVFTEEYRAVRNHLEEAGAGYSTAAGQLEMMLQFFADRGILSRETVANMQNFLQQRMGRRVATGEIVAVTDQLESQLEQEPETVFIRRGQLIDYADEVRNADKYFSPVGADQGQLSE